MTDPTSGPADTPGSTPSLPHGDVRRHTDRHIVSELGLHVATDGDGIGGRADVFAELCVPGTDVLRTSVVATWADVLTGFVAGRAIAPRIPLTLDLEVQVGVPARLGARIDVEASVVKVGRSVVVTSAGIESFDKITDITPEVWDRILVVNLTGTFTCLQLAIPDMVEAGWGRMVTISSSSAQSGAKRMAHYVASKGGVISLTKAFAHELAKHHITVNTIPPTGVYTPMARQAGGIGNVPPVEQMAKAIPLGRAGTPEDIAGACSFLCSDDAEYITGQVIGVNGGMYL